MQNNTTEERLKNIKKSFRLLMNGEASKYMREHGVDYHLNWGVAFTDLQQMAREYGQDYHLAIALWKENIRECKILATLMMPPGEMTPELADLWVEQAGTHEMAEMLAFNLLQHLDYAPVLAFEWIASDQSIAQVVGFNVVARCMANGNAPDDRGISELIDQAQVAMAGNSLPVAHAAYNCLMRLASLGEEYERIVGAALKAAGIDSL